MSLRRPPRAAEGQDVGQDIGQDIGPDSGAGGSDGRPGHGGGLSMPFRPAFSAPGEGGIAPDRRPVGARGTGDRPDGGVLHEGAPEDGYKTGGHSDGGGARGRGVTVLVLALGLGIGILLVAAIVLLQDVAITLPLLLAVLAGILLGPMLAAVLTLRLVRALERDPEREAGGIDALAARQAAALAGTAAPVALAVTGSDGSLLFANRRMHAALPTGLAAAGRNLPGLLGLADEGVDGAQDGDAPRRLLLPDGRAALLLRWRLPHPEGRLLWQLLPEGGSGTDPDAGPLQHLSALAAQADASLPDAHLRLLAADPDPDGPHTNGGDPDLPVLWRAGGALADAPSWRAAGLRIGPGLPRLWIQFCDPGDARPSAATGQTGLGRTGPVSGHVLPAGLAELPVGAVLIDGTGNLLAANAAFGTMSGLQDAVGGTMADLVPEADREALRQLLWPTPATSPVAGSEPATLHFAGSPERSVHLIAGPARDAEPRLVLALDVTAQKGVEQQVAHGQKMQAIGQLAGGVAHDFNNLLTAMIGFCDLLLQRHPPTDQSFADVQQIKQNALRAAGLVRQLLAFSRRQTLRPRPLDVGDVLADLRHLISRLIGERIRLTIVHGRSLGIVRVDRGQLEQVIINLAVNARDAMRDGGTLSITTSAEEIAAPLDRGSDRIPPGRYVRIDVADTGTGVPAEHADKIFDPFFTTKKQGEGTGLGLSTVYGIIRQTGGFVFLDRNGPDGATFSILLPETIPEARDAGGADAGEASERPSPAPRDLTGRETLLLVEDEDAVRLFAARSLRNKGYTVMEAASGEAALELSRAFAGPIHALVTDVVMPNMDGPTLAQEVLRQRPGLAVVFMSGYAEDAVRQNLAGGEMPSTFLQKPFTLNDLAVTVRGALGGAESARWPSKG